MTYCNAHSAKFHRNLFLPEPLSFKIFCTQYAYRDILSTRKSRGKRNFSISQRTEVSRSFQKEAEIATTLVLISLFAIQVRQ